MLLLAAPGCLWLLLAGSGCFWLVFLPRSGGVVQSRRLFDSYSFPLTLHAKNNGFCTKAMETK